MEGIKSSISIKNKDILIVEKETQDKNDISEIISNIAILKDETEKMFQTILTKNPLLLTKGIEKERDDDEENEDDNNN